MNLVSFEAHLLNELELLGQKGAVRYTSSLCDRHPCFCYGRDAVLFFSHDERRVLGCHNCIGSDTNHCVTFSEKGTSRESLFVYIEQFPIDLIWSLGHCPFEVSTSSLYHSHLY